MDVRLDLLDLVDEDENDDAAYEPGWYSVLKELSLGGQRAEAFGPA
jgi:hypothetical protein